MELELSYNTQAEIPAAFVSLYTEKDGKWVLTGVKGLKSQADIDRQLQANQAERTAHAATKAELAKFTALKKTPEELTALVDEEPTLRAKAEATGGKDGKFDQAHVDAIVQAKVAPLQRELETTKAALTEVTTDRDAKAGEITKGRIVNGVRAAAGELKVIDTAIPDVELYATNYFTALDDGSVVTKDGIPGVTPGLDPKSWLTDQQKARPHWWPPSQGGGGGGGQLPGGGANPWTKEGWNLTAQGAYVREHGQESAERLAKAAGHEGVAGARRPA